MISWKGNAICVMMIFLLSSPLHADVETEPNNTKEAADVLTSAASMTAQLYSDTDEDWFSISVTAPNTVKIEFTCSISYTRYWNITVISPNNDILAGARVDRGSATLDVGIVSDGTYHVVIRSDSNYTGESYNLTATSSDMSPGCLSDCTQEKLEAEYDKGYADAMAECSNGLYTQDDVDKMIQAILSWGDTNEDGRIGLSEAVHALQVTSGVKKP